MAKERINLVTSVRELLIQQGYSTVAVVNAVNAALGQLTRESSSEKLGDGSITKKEYKVTETIATKFVGKRNGALDFDAFNGAVGKIEKKFGLLQLAEFPASCADWLKAHEKSFKPSNEESKKEDKKETVTAQK